MRTLLRWTGLVFVTVLVLFTASLAWPQWMLHEHMQRGQFEIWSAVEPDPRIFRHPRLRGRTDHRIGTP
jgi:hypothetical protein